MNNFRSEADIKRLYQAATELYEAGHWKCDRSVDELGLWTNLRDALGREPGNAPKPIAPAVDVEGLAKEIIEAKVDAEFYGKEKFSDWHVANIIRRYMSDTATLAVLRGLREKVDETVESLGGSKAINVSVVYGLIDAAIAEYEKKKEQNEN